MCTYCEGGMYVIRIKKTQFKSILELECNLAFQPTDKLEKRKSMWKPICNAAQSKLHKIPVMLPHFGPLDLLVTRSCSLESSCWDPQCYMCWLSLSHTLCKTERVQLSETSIT